MSSPVLLIVMGGLFLGLGYMGVPVVFAIMAGVLVATAFTPVSFLSMIGQSSTASTPRRFWPFPSSSSSGSSCPPPT